MFENLSPKQRQSLALGILIVILGVILTTIAIPLADIYLENSRQIDVLQSRLLKYTNKIASREQIMQQATQTQNDIKSSELFSTQASLPLVLADMQQRIRSALSAANGDLSSTQNLTQKPQDNLLKIGINIRFAGRMDTLEKVLFMIESSRPYMMIENIKILGVRGERNTRTGKIDPVDKINVSADVVSFIPAPAP